MRVSKPVASLAARLFSLLDTPFCLKQEILLRYGEWDQLATMAISPHTYLDCVSGTEKFRRDALACDFLRKLSTLPTTFDKTEVAEATFLECENKCFETNHVLGLLDLGFGGDALNAAFVDIRRRARKWIKRTLGRLPDSISGRFGPGTAFEMRKQVTTTLADKMWITPHVTRAAELVARHTMTPTFWDRRRTELGLPHLAYTRGNRFSTVPKDGKTHRGICIEPLGNLYCQLGVGSILKGKLSQVGIYVSKDSTVSNPATWKAEVPLPSGQFLHRSLAATASRDGSWATIDLSNASDNVSFELVRQLLPADWFSLLVSLRSPNTLYRGAWYPLDKFSSMGNGFTFELETLLFCAIVHGVAGLSPGLDVFVYGDDILVPTEKALDVVAALKLFGFTPNERKTFVSGPFRESCGGDFFDGTPVRAFFLKEEPSTPLDWFVVHNALKARIPASRQGSALLKHILDQIPIGFRMSGPSWLGDTVLHRAPRFWQCRYRNGIRWVRTLGVAQRPVPLDRWGSEFIYVLATYGVRSPGLNPRGWPGMRVRYQRSSIS